LPVDAVADAILQNDRRSTTPGDEHSELMVAGRDPDGRIASDVGIDSFAVVIPIAKTPMERDRSIRPRTFEVELARQAVRAELPGRLGQQLMRRRPAQESIAVAHHGKVSAGGQAICSDVPLEDQRRHVQPGSLERIGGRAARQPVAARSERDSQHQCRQNSRPHHGSTRRM
jgi:hypothetical protein